MFIFKKWENRVPYYALKNWDEEKILAAEETWKGVRSKGIRAALIATFGGGWQSVLKEAGKQTLKYGGRKALGVISGVICGYFGSVSIVLVTKSVRVVKIAKSCHSVFSGCLDVAELCATAPINIIEIVIFGRPVLLDAGDGFDLLSETLDPIEDISNLFDKKK